MRKEPVIEILDPGLILVLIGGMRRSGSNAVGKEEVTLRIEMVVLIIHKRPTTIRIGLAREVHPQLQDRLNVPGRSHGTTVNELPLEGGQSSVMSIQAHVTVVPETGHLTLAQGFQSQVGRPLPQYDRILAYPARHPEYPLDVRLDQCHRRGINSPQLPRRVRMIGIHDRTRHRIRQRAQPGQHLSRRRTLGPGCVSFSALTCDWRQTPCKQTQHQPGSLVVTHSMVPLRLRYNVRTHEFTVNPFLGVRRTSVPKNKGATLGHSQHGEDRELPL